MRSSPPKVDPNPPTPRDSDSPDAADAKRRGFLLALGAGGIGAAAFAARSLPGAVAVAGSGSIEVTSGEGYRLTDHVKRYYRTAKT